MYGNEDRALSLVEMARGHLTGSQEEDERYEDEIALLEQVSERLSNRINEATQQS